MGKQDKSISSKTKDRSGDEISPWPSCIIAVHSYSDVKPKGQSDIAAVSSLNVSLTRRFRK